MNQSLQSYRLKNAQQQIVLLSCLSEVLVHVDCVKTAFKTSTDDILWDVLRKVRLGRLSDDRH